MLKNRSPTVGLRCAAPAARTGLAADHHPARSGEVRTSMGDPRRAVEQLGFRAETALTDGLAMTLHVPCLRVAREAEVGI